MAEQVAILVGGQSQAGKVGELTKFEDRAPEVSVRNPAVFPNTSTLSRSFTQDTYTVPGVWPDKYKNLRLRGRATTAVMQLTPFNPGSTYYEMQDVSAAAIYGGHVTPCYPGYAAVADAQESADNAIVDLVCAFQADPVGLTVIRQGTGTSHTIAAGWVNTAPGRITLNTPDTAPKVSGEVYKLPLQCRANGTTTTIASNVRFGGYHDGGSLFEAAYFGGTTAVLGGFTVQPYPITIGAQTTGDPVVLTITNRYYRPGQRVRFTTTGTNSDLTVTTTDYWITRIVHNAGSSSVYVSATRNGPEVVHGGVAATGTHMMALLPQHFHSTMAGMRVRFTSGALNGQVFDLTDNTVSANTPTDDFDLTTLTTMPSVPQTGDTFEIEPQQINAEDVAWDSFGHFLPLCTMEGQPYGQLTTLAPSYATVSPGTAVTFTFAPSGVYEGMRFRIFDYYSVAAATTTAAPTSGSFSGPAQVLYAVNVNYATGACNVATSYGGSPISDATLTASQCAAFQDEHPDRANPLPPGLNYDNSRSVPSVYQPYFGGYPSLQLGERGAAFAVSLAQAMHEKLGRSIYVIPTAVAGSSLGRREAAPDSTSGFALGAFDSKVQLDWSPNGEVDSCYAAMVRKLVMAKRSAASAGHTLKIAGVFFAQGESDILFTGMLDRYAENLRALVAAVRAKIVELGMWDGPVESIPWWHPQVPSAVGADWANNGYVGNVAFNQILTDMANEDAYFITRSTDDATISYDAIHYNGSYLWTLGQNAFADWDSIAPAVDDRTRVDICNQALKNVGESRVIESLTENTTPAQLCRRYFPVASKTLLESFAWPFATLTVQLTATTNTRSELDWQYAYRLPVNFLGVVGLGPDLAGATVAGEVDHSIEGGVLYCNLSTLTLRYTTIAPDPADYSQHYTNALSHQLSAEIAPAIAQGEKGAQLAQAQLQLARYYVDLAKTYVAQRERHANPSDPTYAWD